MRVGAAALGVVAGDDAPPPGIGGGIDNRAVKDRIMRAGRLVRLVARHQRQIGRYAKARRIAQPGRVIGKGAVLAPPLPGVHQSAQRQRGLADAALNLLSQS